MSLRAALLIALALSGALIGRARAEAVDMALVLAVDVSKSVDADEYQLQHEGIARRMFWRGGQWHDAELFAILDDEPVKSPS